MADRPSKRGGDEASNPSTYPTGVPPMYSGHDHSFTLQAVMEMQRTLGELKESSKQVSEQLKDHNELIRGVRDRLNWLSGGAAVVTIVTVAAVGFAAWVIDKAVDRALEAYKIVPVSEQPKATGPSGGATVP